MMNRNLWWCGGHALPHEDSEAVNAGIRAAKSFAECALATFAQKHIASWCLELEDFEVSHKIQPGEYSMGGGMDGAMHESALGRERQLERRRMERRGLLGRQPERVERRRRSGGC